MNIKKYDYYGNYENNNDSYAFNVQELQKKQKEKEKTRVKIYETISSKCFKKIKETSENESTYCFFQLPEYIPGLPLYNMTECVLYLLNLLKEKGFNARYCNNYIIYISWHIPKSNLKLIEQPKENSKKSNLIENLNLKYKPIENYNSFGDFIPRKRN